MIFLLKSLNISCSDLKVKVKLKVYAYSPDIPVNRFSGLNIINPHVLELALSQFHRPGENAALFSPAAAIRIVQILVPPGTHYCWVDRGRVDSKIAQGFYT